MSYRKISFTITMLAIAADLFLIDLKLAEPSQVGKTLLVIVFLYAGVCFYKKEGE